MSDKKKPPVPARPKNLVVFNSRHLPKPPETFSTESVTNFIKDLNLDVKDEGNDSSSKRQEPLGTDGKYQNSVNGNEEEDSYGYLEPVSFSSANPSDVNANVSNINRNSNLKKSSDESCKLGEIFQKLMMRNNSVSSEASEVDDSSKPQFSQNQWQRPLPLPPVETKSEVTCMPWYKNVDRRKGEEILRNGIDGYFLVRPSSNADTYLTLTLWYNKRVYNIPIRKRKDGKFALGTPKANEQCFDSIEYMVKNYQSEKLVLYSNGVQTGKTLLTTYPP